MSLLVERFFSKCFLTGLYIGCYSLLIMKVKDSSAATLSSKGQVTIPVKIRRLLKIKEKDSVEFGITYDNVVVLQPQSYRLKDSFGSVKKINKTFQEQREIAKKNRLKKYEE